MFSVSVLYCAVDNFLYKHLGMIIRKYPCFLCELLQFRVRVRVAYFANTVLVYSNINKNHLDSTYKIFLM
jgi:hypothetical protein